MSILNIIVVLTTAACVLFTGYKAMQAIRLWLRNLNNDNCDQSNDLTIRICSKCHHFIDGDYYVNNNHGCREFRHTHNCLPFKNYDVNAAKNLVDKLYGR